MLRVIDRSLIREGGIERVLIIEGSLSDSSSLDEVAPFLLHDALLYKFEIDSPLDAGSGLVILGLLSDWRSTVELCFLDVTDFESQGFSFFRCFSVKDLIIGNGGGVAHFNGEFQGQFFSFKFKRATYKKYDLKAPLSRDEIGWGE